VADKTSFRTGPVMVAALLMGLLAPSYAASAASFTIQQFVAAQQRGYCTEGASPPCPNDQLFVPPVPNYVGWGGLHSGKACTFEEGDLCRFALVDYAGIAGNWLKTRGKNLGTTWRGSVDERPLAGNRVEISVRLVTHRALVWVSQLSSYRDMTGFDSIFSTSPLLFGARPQDVLRGWKPALADSVFEVRYTARRGDPIPNLIPLLLGPAPNVAFTRFRAEATGWLRPAFFGGGQGGPGRATIVQLVPNGQTYTAQKIALRPL
jgi:hypothetical protein